MSASKHNSKGRLLACLSTGLLAVLLVSVAPSSAQGAVASADPGVSIVDATTVNGGMASITRVASGLHTLHLTVGHSMFIDTRARLRRVYVADPAVLTSVTMSPNQILVTAMNAGLSSLTLMDESGQAQSYVVSSDVDVEGLRTAMADALRGDAIKVESSGGRVTLTGEVKTQTESDAAVKLASLYTKEVANALVVAPSHPKQVRLQVRILEVDRSKLLQLGVNLFNPGGNTNFLASTTTGQYPSTMISSVAGAAASAAGTVTTSNPLNFMLYSAKLNLGATIQDLQTKQVLQILAEPTITTISGVKANFLSGGEFPFPVVQPGGSGSAPVISIEFRPFGVKLEFTPFVNDDGTVRLKVAPEVSSLDYSNAVSLSGVTIPALSTRRAETEVELRSNQSFAISGLLDQRTTDIMTKTPGAADIPILGYLFKSKNVNHGTTELVVVVTPTVVDPLTDGLPPAQPDMPIPTLNTGSFDKSLGRDLNPAPAPPPTKPGEPYGQQVIPPPFVPSASTQGDANPGTNAKPTAAAQPSAAIDEKRTIATPKTSAKTSSTVASDGNLMVEVMTLSHQSDAEMMVDALKRRGYDVAANHAPNDGLIHLDVGPFANQKDAESMRQRLLKDGYDATIK